MIEVSAAVPQDVQAIAALLEEMDRFYETPTVGSRADRVRRISEALFASPPAAYAMLARDGAVLAGVAAYSFLWPAVGLTRSLYLKDLYVADAYRRRGVGKLLMQALAEVAGKHKCSRVEWTTDIDNVGAQTFYRNLGVPEHTSKIFYRAEDTGRGFLPI